MTLKNRRETLMLFLGDILFLIFSLWISLIIRYTSIPSWSLFISHLIPFSFIFIVWITVYLISDLYRNQTLIQRRRLPANLLRAQIINSIIAISFFYFIPYFGITPKTNLFITLFVSFIFLSLWRLYIINLFYVGKRERTLIIGDGIETNELIEEINNNPKYKLKITHLKHPDAKEIEKVVNERNIGTLVLNMRSDDTRELSSNIYHLLFFKIRFIDLHNLYEDIFERVPLSLLEDNWFLENIWSKPKKLYDIVKRLMDISIAILFGLISLFAYPFIYIAMRIEDKGPFFIYQDRVGENGKKIRLIKIRTMIENDNGKWSNKNNNRVTRIGYFLRRSRLDELPQLLNVLYGDVSLIGPRPEFPQAVSFYTEKIPHYFMRHLIKPGLSGWAQICHKENPHHTTDIPLTSIKLSYDLYYLKNRGIATDLTIALKTIRTILSRSGV